MRSFVSPVFVVLKALCAILSITAIAGATGCSTTPYPGLVTRTPSDEEVRLVQTAFPGEFSPDEDVFAQKLAEEQLYRLVGKQTVPMSDADGNYKLVKVSLLRDPADRGVVTYDLHVYEHSQPNGAFKKKHTFGAGTVLEHFTAKQLALAEAQ